jgi:hypothetical protein
MTLTTLAMANNSPSTIYRTSEVDRPLPGVKRSKRFVETMKGCSDEVVGAFVSNACLLVSALDTSTATTVASVVGFNASTI